METQSFKKHAQYVPGFHMITLGTVLLVLITAIILLVKRGLHYETIFYILVAISLGLFFYYVRSFAVGNQDRIIRAEENFRCFRLTGNVLDKRLRRGQIIALRFADDDEYAALMQKALNENLKGKDIKAAIQKWRADHHRV